MNNSQLNDIDITCKSDKRLLESRLYPIMKGFLTLVDQYPIAHIKGVSDKRTKVVDTACSPIYANTHIMFSTSVSEYGNSVILVENEMVVKYMIKEAALFCFHLDNFYKRIKSVNNIQELQLYYKQFKLKPKQVLDGLIADLKLYSGRYHFKLNVKSVVESYNNEKKRLVNKS